MTQIRQRTGKEKVYHANNSNFQKLKWLYLDQTIRIKDITRDKEGNFLIMKSVKRI